MQRRIEDHCPEAVGYDSSKYEAKLKRIGHGIYILLESSDAEEFHAIEEVSEPEILYEGATKKISVNAYERNPKARKKCIEHYGLKCCVCNFDFEQTYGDIGKSYIHVHHIFLISKTEKVYEVDPIKDLRPVCANCHAMIHRSDPPTSIQQLREIIKNQANDIN